jgi:hypothetical protein
MDSEHTCEYQNDVCVTCGRDKPKWIDLYGIDPDFTGGMDIKEFLDQSRGEA